ncbi:hypothetical protein C8Q75DRAFT_727597, partial [Abortiporus biennis]
HPIKTFVYHSFSDFLAGLLANPQLEQLMDEACDNLLHDIHNSSVITSDNCEAEYLRSFKGLDSIALFIDWKNDGCFVFSLNIDFFTPEGKSIYNATISCGIISLACMNLPSNIYYKPENMYLAGVIV